MRSVFSSASAKDVQLGNGGPPGSTVGAASGWRAVTRVLRSCGNDVANVMFPTDCRVCGGPVVALSGVQVCESCVGAVGPQAQGVRLCSRCGDAISLGVESARFVGAMGQSECSMCRMTPPEFERAVAYALYDEEVREMLHLLKFGGMRKVAEAVLREGMAAAMLQLGMEREMVVVPVPLFAARERKRGFNQAEVLASAGLGLVKKLRPVWKLELRRDVLLRLKDTRALFAMDPSERRKGLAGAFKVGNAEAIVGREVLLVDDIMTTGATARECARVLKRAGAAKVFVVTMARAYGASFAAGVSDEVAMWDGGDANTHLSEARGGATAFVEPDEAKRQRFW